MSDPSDPSDPGDPGDTRPLPGGGEGAPPPPAPKRRSRLPFIIGGVVVLLLVLAGIAAVLLAGGDDDGGDEGARSRTLTSSERQAEEARNEDDPADIEVPDAEEPGDLGNDARFDRLADECFEGDPSSCDDLFRESDIGSDYEKYGSTCGKRTDEGQTGGCAALYPDPDLADHREQCADGDNGACDDLYNDASLGSVDEHFGSTCAGRSEDELAGDCEAENP